MSGVVVLKFELVLLQDFFYICSTLSRQDVSFDNREINHQVNQ